MIISDKSIKLWSSIGPRATLGLALLDIEKQIDNLIIISCDVSTSAGLDRFRKQVSKKYVELGICEQNMIGVAAGMANEGFNVITTTFSPFQVLRCAEQIKVNLGYMENKITMVGLASGLVLGNLGYTHCSIEDIGVLRSIPNINILSPADSLETVKALEASIYSKKSCYIRLTGNAPNPPVYQTNYKFKIGENIKLKQGKDVTIFVSGARVASTLKASENLSKKNIECSVVNVHTIKPIDKKNILEESREAKFVVSVEEHNIIGGLGSAIAEIFAENNFKKKLIRVGIDDSYSAPGSYEYLLKQFNLDTDGVEKIVIDNY